MLAHGLLQALEFHSSDSTQSKHIPTNQSRSSGTPESCRDTVYSQSLLLSGTGLLLSIHRSGPDSLSAGTESGLRSLYLNRRLGRLEILSSGGAAVFCGRTPLLELRPAGLVEAAALVSLTAAGGLFLVTAADALLAGLDGAEETLALVALTVTELFDVDLVASTKHLFSGSHRICLVSAVHSTRASGFGTGFSWVLETLCLCSVVFMGLRLVRSAAELDLMLVFFIG